VHKKQADQASKDEQSRRIEELSHLSEDEIQHRITVGKKLLEVQKELLSTHTPIKVPLTDQVLLAFTTTL